jgi:S1-C subfamily serine protease
MYRWLAAGSIRLKPPGIVVLLTATLLFSASGMAQVSFPLSQSDATMSCEEEDDLADLSDEERINVSVYENSHRCVVHIETRGDTDSMLNRLLQAEGSGSGSVWDQDGHILTNYHVIKGATQLVVTLHDGKQFDATLVGHDVANDIAILKIDPKGHPLCPVQAGRSDKLKVGQRVFALGSPLGLEQTMTVGIVSSLNRTLPSLSKRTMKSIIQIDAALNRGNSGGPLMNSRGEMIGMNTAIASRIGENSGIGFAIPSATILRIAPQLIQFGKVRRPSIGIESISETAKGLLLVTLEPGGPAEKAGLQGVSITRRRTLLGEVVRRDYSAADILTEVDGQAVRNADDLLSSIETRRAGESVTLTLKRNEETIQVPIQLVEETPAPATATARGATTQRR